MRKCKQCGKRKPLSDFAFAHRNRGLRRATCRACIRKRDRNLAAQSKQWIRNFAAQWSRQKRDVVETANTFVNGGRVLAGRPLHPYHQLRHAAILAYGGYACACCGESEPGFLTIDHVNGGGGRQRKQIGGGVYFYRRLRDRGYPEGFQVLCYNCNCGRHRNGGVCPHKAVDSIGISKVNALFTVSGYNRRLNMADAGYPGGRRSQS